jgi:hypothetical protein
MPATSSWQPGRAGPLAARLLLGSAIALALVAALHALVWRWAGSEMQAGVDAWIASRRALGWRVTHGPPQRGGWPLAASLTLPDVTLHGGTATLPGGFGLAAESLVMRVALPRLDRLLVAMPGRNRLRFGDVELPFAADRLSIAVPLERNVLPREATAEAERLRLATPAGPFELRALRLDVETRLTATEGEPALQLALRAEDIVLPPGPPALVALGRQLERATLEAAVTGPVPPGRFPTTKAEAWRDGGGSFEVRGLTLDWGKVGLGITATLTLDEALQPMGAGSLKMRGAAEAIAAAQSAGLIPASMVRPARMLVQLRSRVPSGGGPPQFEVPLTLEERTLAAGRFPLAHLPRLVWPSPPPLPDAAQDPSLPAPE